MNIFFLDADPVLAARYHCDRHVVKMILETAQLLSTAHHVLNGAAAPEDLYRQTHVNHPCAIWVRERAANYNWAFRLLEGLLSEYTFRYGRKHTTTRLLDALATKPSGIRAGLMTPPACAMPEQYILSNPVESYRTYYREGKAHLLKYTRREVPGWLY